MYLANAYKAIGKAACRKDDRRPVLQALHVRRIDATHGELAAADGFILAVVPCTLEPDDVPGLISQECLAGAFKASGKHLSGAVLLLKADSARAGDGTEWPRPEGQFPDYARIVPPLGRTQHAPAELDPARVLQLLTALGEPSTGGTFQHSGPGGPTIVHTRVPGAGDTPAAPFGIVMPYAKSPAAWLETDETPPAGDHAQGVSDHTACDAKLARMDKARRDVQEVSQMHLARVQELLGENAALMRQHDEREYLIAAGDKRPAPPIAGAGPNVTAAHAYVNGFVSAGKRAYAAASLEAILSGACPPARPADVDSDTAAHITRKLARKLAA